jgi:sugar lactone lactonase YvrE
MEPAFRPGRSGLMLPSRAALSLLLSAWAAATAAAQADPILASRAAYQQAVRAYEAGDIPAFLTHAREADRLRPDHGGVIYALASACALSGDTAGAFAALRRFAALGYAADVAADSDFKRLVKLPAFAALRRSLARNAEPVLRSRRAFTLPERDLLTEGIAWDSVSRTFFVGSVRHRKILRIQPSGRVSVLVTPGRDGLLAPLGLRADPARRLLWVAASAVPQMEEYDTADAGRSGLFAFDLGTGELRGRYLIPPDGQAHALGDVIVSRTGDVYATDSRAPAIYRVPRGADSIERFLTSPLLLSAQGLALDGDERTMYVVDYSRGLLRVDLAARAVRPVATNPGALALGIDGLYRVGDDLVGVQNGVEPHRVVRLHLERGGDRITTVEVLERARPDYAEPTLGVVVQGALYYVANSQWERFKDDGTIDSPERLRRPLVLRLPL